MMPRLSMTILASMSKWKICIEQLNAQARVEADSPRVARSDIRCSCARRRNPFGRGLTDELRVELCRRRPFEALAANQASQLTKAPDAAFYG